MVPFNNIVCANSKTENHNNNTTACTLFKTKLGPD